MTKKAETLVEQRFGRMGLVLPTKKDLGRHALYYFRDLFSVNGYDVATDTPWSRSGFAHEMVLPASSEKPLVVMRARYESLSWQAARYSRDEFGYNDVNLDGNERYDILLAPVDVVGALQVAISAHYKHVSGHAVAGYSWPEPETDIFTSVPPVNLFNKSQLSMDTVEQDAINLFERLVE